MGDNKGVDDCIEYVRVKVEAGGRERNPSTYRMNECCRNSEQRMLKTFIVIRFEISEELHDDSSFVVLDYQENVNLRL